MPVPPSLLRARLDATYPALPTCDPKDLPAFRDLLDARAYLESASYAALVSEDRVTVGGDAAAPSLDVEQVHLAVARDSAGAWWPLSAAGTVTPGALAASTIHYLFIATTTAGVPSFVVSTSAPTGRYRITGSQRQRFLAAFATGLLGYPLPAVVRERSGRYIASSGRAELVALAAGRATTWTAVDLSHLVPPWATTAWVMARAYMAVADGPTVSVEVRRSSADAGSFVAVEATVRARVVTGTPTNVDGIAERLVQIPLINQGFEYQLNAAVTASDPYGARFTVVGWD